MEPIRVNENKKSYIVFRPRILSSIYPESSALASLSTILQEDGKVNVSGNPEQVLKVIQRLPVPICIAFFPAVLNLLFKILGSCSDKLADLTVLAIFSILTKYVFLFVLEIILGIFSSGL